MGFVIVVVVDCICEIFISMSSCRQYVCWLTFYSIGKVPLLHTHFRWRHILNINRCHKFLDQISNQGLFPMTASFVTEHGKWTWGYNLCTSSLSFEAPDKHWDTVYSGAHATAQHTGGSPRRFQKTDYWPFLTKKTRLKKIAAQLLKKKTEDKKKAACHPRRGQ